jgi:hypothetical protein
LTLLTLVFMNKTEQGKYQKFGAKQDLHRSIQSIVEQRQMMMETKFESIYLKNISLRERFKGQIF